MEKLELKLRNMEYFVMKLEDATTEEKIELLAAIGEIKKKVQEIKDRKEVNNVVENIESGNKNSDNTANDNRDLESNNKK